MIVTVALGIGAATTLFSVANSVLLRPLPWPEADRLVQLTESRGGRQGRIPGTDPERHFPRVGRSAADDRGARGLANATITLNTGGRAERLEIASVSPNLFEMLRARPVIGRTFAANEASGPCSRRSRSCLYGFWLERFGGRDDVLGSAVEIDGSAVTIVGVMPHDFGFPDSKTRAWTAWAIPTVDDGRGNSRGVILRALARLRPGVTAAQAAAEGTARAIAAPDAGPVAMALFGAKDPIQVSVIDAREAMTAEVRPAILLVFAAATLLFVTAVVNVANLQLARSTARHRELTICAALGAGTARLSRQLLFENLTIGALGGGAGLLTAAVLHARLPSILPAGFPRGDAIAIESTVVIVAVALTIIASLACGLLPLIYVRRLDLVRSLSEGGMASVGAGRSRLAVTRAVIVSSQVAVTCVLLVGATLLARSFLAQVNADRGYDPSNLLTAAIPFPRAYAVERKAQALDAITERIKSRPGVTHAAFGAALPLVSAGGFVTFKFNSPFGGREIEVESIRRIVSPGYFGALGLRVAAGRPLTDTDDASVPGVVVVNRSFVRNYLDDVPIERAVSQSLGLNALRGTKVEAPARIVGVVDDV